VKQSPSSEATNCPGGQKISRVLWKPNFHYRVHKVQPLDSNLS